MPDSNTEPMIVEDFLRRRASQLKCHSHPLVLGVDRVGIEVELENLGDLSHHSSTQSLVYWDIISDGSLRNNGMEFITKGDGIGGDVLYEASVELEGFLRDFSPDPSWRCSTHVHVDVRDMTLEQLKLLTLAYAYFERFLFKECGWKRYKSNFCVPLGLAQKQIEVVSDLFRQDKVKDFMMFANNNWPKYTAINLAVVNTFGTYEFRMPLPTFKSMSLIKTANRFLALKRVVMDWTGDQVEFIEYLSTTDIRLIFQKSVGRGTVFKDEDRAFGFALARDIIAISALKAKSIRLGCPQPQEEESHVPPVWDYSEDDETDGSEDPDNYEDSVSSW
jgi:hypothetical protein